MTKQVLFTLLSVCFLLACGQPRVVEDTRMSGNPLFEGWYADPCAAIFGDKFWVFPTFSARYTDQLHLSSFSSPDLIEWTKHERIIDNIEVDWIWQAMWAPAIISNNGRYYLFFGGNDMQRNEELGGIGVAVADHPGGPFRDLIGRPLIDQIVHGAQPIDQFVFRDVDGQHYIFWGGWNQMNVAKLTDCFTGFIAFDCGEYFLNKTPHPDFVEGPYMFIRNGKYYLMWSEGGWGGPYYRVAYGIGDNPLGPFERIATVLIQDPEVATSTGHHSVVHAPNTDRWFIFYHRRELGETGRDNRVTAIGEMFFDENGHILPIEVTREGVRANPLR